MLVITRRAGEAVVLIVDRRVVMDVGVGAIESESVRLEFETPYDIAVRTREEANREIEAEFDDSGPRGAA